MKRTLQSGISLVEVLVVVFIVGLLAAAAIPSFQTWMQNVQIRTAAESLLNGLQTAQNEAIRRNDCMQIEFAIDGKTSWTVNPCESPDQVPPFMRRAHEEGSVNASLVRTPPTSAIVSFNAFGRIVNPSPSDGNPYVSQLDICNPTMVGAMAADMRPLRIEIPLGGSIRMCDPSPSVAVGDPRRCTVPVSAC